MCWFGVIQFLCAFSTGIWRPCGGPTGDDWWCGCPLYYSYPSQRGDSLLLGPQHGAVKIGSQLCE